MKDVSHARRWFWQLKDDYGFRSYFFAPYMQLGRDGIFPIRPVRLSYYFNDSPSGDYVLVQTGARNIAQANGFDFSQWSASPKQKRALEKVWDVSQDYHRLEREVEERKDKAKDPDRIKTLLNQARDCILKAETSCYFFRGNAWNSKVYDQAKPARIILRQIGDILYR